MTAREYILSVGGAWPDESAVAMMSPQVQRIAEAYHDSPELMRAVTVCRRCEHFVEPGWTCKQNPSRCGGCSVRGIWAADGRCPEGRW